MIDLNSKLFPFLSSTQIEDLKKYINDAPHSIMAHQLAVILGLELPKSIAIISILYSIGMLDIKLLTYHNCDLSTPMLATPFIRGYPKLPFHCNECDLDVENFQELDFDILATFITEN